MSTLPDRAALASALAEAGHAHHDYETVELKGVRDALWPGFYAAFVLGRLGNFITASRLARLLAESKASTNWAGMAADHVIAMLSE